MYYNTYMYWCIYVVTIALRIYNGTTSKTYVYSTVVIEISLQVDKQNIF